MTLDLIFSCILKDASSHIYHSRPKKGLAQWMLALEMDVICEFDIIDGKIYYSDGSSSDMMYEGDSPLMMNRTRSRFIVDEDDRNELIRMIEIALMALEI